MLIGLEGAHAFLCEHLREVNTFGISEVSTELGTSMFVVSREVPRGDYANSSVENDIDADMAGRKLKDQPSG